MNATRPIKRTLPSAGMAAWFLIGLSIAQVAAGAPAPRTRTLTFNAEKQEWVETAPPPPGTPEGDLFRIREMVSAGQHRPALSAINRYIKTYGESDAFYPDMLAARAQVHVARRDYQKAHGVLQQFLNEFGGIALTSEALRLEFVIAEAFLAGAKRNFLGLPLRSGVELAYSILDEISAEYTSERIAEYALKTKGDHLFRTGEHELAELEYSRLLREFPRGRYHQYALRRSADAAIAAFRGAEYDDSALIEAQERYEEYHTRYAVAADRAEIAVVLDNIREQRAEKDYLIADYYERTDHLSSAVYYYQTVLRDWPDTLAATKAANRLELLGVQSMASATTHP